MSEERLDDPIENPIKEVPQPDVAEEDGEEDVTDPTPVDEEFNEVEEEE